MPGVFVRKTGQLTGRTGVVLTRLRDSWRISLDINEEFPGVEDVHARAFQNKGHFLYPLCVVAKWAGQHLSVDTLN